MASVASIPYPTSVSSMEHEHNACGGCHNSVDDGGGVVVAFGNSLWHVDCFKCAKCGNRVSADTNLLLLSDGSPVCAACSYNCAVCKKPISHEAIMTGDESYHAACFTCKTCGRHIGELVFAKTTQGIYCMACHNERVARSRRHAEQRKNRNKPLRDGTRDKDRDKLREKPSNPHLRENGTITPDTPPTTPGLNNPQITSADSAVSHAAKRISTQSISATLYNSRPHGDPPIRQPLPPIESSPTTTRPSSPLPSPAIQTTDASPPPSSSRHPSREGPAIERGDTLPLPKSPEPPGPRRKSFDDGVRPLNGFLTPEAVSSLSRAPSSAGRTTRAEKRNSINPAMRLDWAAAKPLVDSEVHLSPIPISPPPEASGKQQSLGTPNHSRDSDERSPSPNSRGPQKSSPVSRSPLTETFYSPPTSPSFLTTSHPRSQTEQIVAQEREYPTRRPSLPDTTGPLLHHQSSIQSQLPGSGRASPARPLTPNGHVGVSAHQPQLLLTEHSRAGTPMRDLPSLPPEAEADRASEADDDDEADPVDDQKADERVSIPLALPPMSFPDNDTSFHDLLRLGRQSNVPPVQTAEKAAESNTSMTKPGAQQAEEDKDKEAGPSKVPTTTAVVSSPPVKMQPTPPSPLMALPRRNESLSRKMSARKPVPKAIVLPDTFEADMAFDLDESSNSASSPGCTPGRSDGPPKAPDTVGRSNKRPGSAGVVSSGPPPLSPRSPRRSSTTGSPLISEPSTATPTRSTSNPVVTVTDSGSASARTARPTPTRQDTTELVAKRIKEALSDAQESGATTVRLDREFLEVIYMAVQAGREKLHDMRGKFDGMRRASQQFIDGLSVAQEEYDNELAARREAEAEVTRLKVQLSGQAARLTELSAGERKRDVAEQMSRDMSASLRGLERDVSKLKAERDLTVAEVEELAAAKISSSQSDGNLQRSLTHRFDNLKVQYRRELEPLVQQREALLREINELKEERNLCLEETTALNLRNEELAALNAQTARQIESGAQGGAMRSWSPMPSSVGSHLQQQGPATPSKNTPLPPVPQGSGYLTSGSSVTTSTTLQEERTPNGKGKWFKPSKEAIKPMSDGLPAPEKELRHNFQQLTILRFARCDHCGDKMWGTQLRCNICNVGCHNRCVGQITLTCVSDPRPRDDIVNIAPLQPSMFGRDLIEQVRTDSAKEHRDIPIIVEKCISAVEVLAMDYEGIYRKSGGSSQSKAITQLFERGNYDAFDLRDSEAFNDISSVTSVLKTYFRQLPNPLLTHALHEAFVGAASIREPRAKAESLSSLVYQLPSEHFHTLRYLMLHLYRVQLRCGENLMNARNLGMVFGPTLMRSNDPNRELVDMAGKALAIEWLVENAPSVFREDT